MKLIKDGKRQSYSINKNARQIKTAKAGDRIPGSRFFKPSQVSIEWVSQPERSTSIQRHGYNVQSANLTSNQQMLLQERTNLKPNGTVGNMYPTVQSLPINIEVMSGSTGS